MTTYENLLRAAGTCQRDALLMLADCCEEEGRAETAAGYRWLAEKKRWPRYDESTDQWKLYASSEADRAGVPYDPEDLPFESLRDGDGVERWFRYQKPEEALEAGAKAVGAWLRKEAGKERAG